MLRNSFKLCLISVPKQVSPMDYFSCSFLTSRSLLPYIFHSWQRPFMNHHFCDAPRATCQHVKTKSSIHFCKIRFSLSQEKLFSSTLCHFQNKGWQPDPGNCHESLWNSRQRLSSLSFQFWLSPQSFKNYRLSISQCSNSR